MWLKLAALEKVVVSLEGSHPEKIIIFLPCLFPVTFFVPHLVFIYNVPNCIKE